MGTLAVRRLAPLVLLTGAVLAGCGGRSQAQPVTESGRQPIVSAAGDAAQPIQPGQPGQPAQPSQPPTQTVDLSSDLQTIDDLLNGVDGSINGADDATAGGE